MGIALPSIPEVVSIVNEAVTVFSEGGQKAIALLFVINLAAVILFVWLFFKFIFNFLKQHNDEKEQALAAKDNLLNEARNRLENLNDQYSKLLTQSLEREQMLTNEVRELKTLVTLFLTGNNKVKNYDNDDDNPPERRRTHKKQ